MIKNFKKRSKAFLLTLILLLAVFSTVSVLNSIPDNIILFENENYTFENKLLTNLFSMDITTGKSGRLIDGKVEADSSINEGIYKGEVKLLGYLPVKTVDINVKKNKQLAVCGNPIGVKLFTDGIMVIGLTSFTDIQGYIVSPAKDAGVKVGDLIKEVNGQSVKTMDEFTSEIEKIGDGDITLRIERKGEYINIDMKSKKDSADKKHKIGLWVRNSTAGIGTLTFYDPETNVFGALGHGITDADTGMILPSTDGSITEANITSVKKGAKGNPGELVGTFSNDGVDIGKININSEQGIYGKADSKNIKTSDNLYYAASRNQIKEGKAQIFCCINGQEIGKFDIEIQKISRQSNSVSKGMIIKITDEKLIATTGGIVQGMSGSPIVQNNMIIGAVTHVFVNDPTRGYGIFIDSMMSVYE